MLSRRVQSKRNCPPISKNRPDEDDDDDDGGDAVIKAAGSSDCLSHPGSSTLTNGFGPGVGACVSIAFAAASKVMPASVDGMPLAIPTGS
jgi:hypothetical protein